MIYTKKIREEQGGTYGVGSALQGRRRPTYRIDVHVLFSTNPESADLLSKIAIDELKAYAENGPTDEQFNMAMENLKKNLPEQRINNGYWMKALQHYAEYGENYDALYEEAINSLTKDDIKNILQAILAEGNFIGKPEAGKFAVATAGDTKLTVVDDAPAEGTYFEIHFGKNTTEGMVNTGKDFFVEVHIA